MTRHSVIRRLGLSFFGYAAALMYGVFFLGIPIAQGLVVDRQYRDGFLITVALLATVTAFRRSTEIRGSRLERVILFCAIALPTYALFQIVPLPLWLLKVVSPGRAELLDSLAPVLGRQTFGSLSIVPAATFTHFLLLAAYAAMFFASADFGRRAGANIWIVAAPLILIAGVESILGLLQFSATNAPAKGTYGIRNHLAGLLEMAYPFAAMYGLAALRTRRRRDARWLQALAGFSVAGLLLAGLLVTLSRGGLAALLVSALLVIVIVIYNEAPPKRRLWAMVGLFGALIVIGALVIPLPLVLRLAEHTSEGRYTVFREALPVLRDYPLFGCGLGGFESAFLKYKAAEGILVVDYAHNDFLQYLEELGAVGFSIPALLIGCLMVRTIRHATSRTEARWFAIACTGAITAILVHSAFDFNLYVAANAASLAWICGMAAGQQRDRGERPRKAMEFEPASLHRSTPFR